MIRRVDALELGTPIAFTHTLDRVTGDYDKDGASWPKSWVARPTFAGSRGILVGVRTLANGKNTGGGWEEPIEFKPTEHFAALLISFDLRRRPVLVLPEHATNLASPELEAPDPEPVPFVCPSCGFEAKTTLRHVDCPSCRTVSPVAVTTEVAS